MRQPPATAASRKTAAAARLLSLGAAAFLLSACVFAPHADNDVFVGDPVDMLQGQHAATERRLATAAADAMSQGKTEEAFIHYEKLYQRDSRNPDVAVNYAQLLRRTGKAGQAVSILAPFAEGKRKDSSRAPLPMIKNEYAAALIETGKFDVAQSTLAQVLQDTAATDFYADAHHLMGVSLDAQGQHKDAEQHFRDALETWTGDKTSVMNNLALNLASQAEFDESLLLLRKAQLMSPEKTEIARNIQLVSDLRDAVIPKAPVNLQQ